MVVNDELAKYIHLIDAQNANVKALKEKKTLKAILFIDLSRSTEIKTQIDDQEWLSYVFNFISRLQIAAKKTKGTVVKQIGDELLVTFDAVLHCEAYIEAVMKDEELATKYTFKIAVDFGEVYLLNFEQTTNDPYGIVVDRCARIAKLCKDNSVLASESYLNTLKEHTYTKLVPVKLKGIPEPVTVFWRSLVKLPNKKKYLAVLLESMNSKQDQVQGYKYLPRAFTDQDFGAIKEGKGMPFLTRYLLNVPRSPINEREIVKDFVKDEEKNIFNYVGYLVEFDGVLSNFTIYNNHVFGNYIQVVVVDQLERLKMMIHFVNLHPNYDEVVRKLKGTKIHVVGIVTQVSKDGVHVDYAEISKR